MKNSNALRRSVQGALVLVFLLGFVAAFVFELDAQKPLASAISAPAANASAEQDLRMVMQELERERLDRSNANSSAVSMHATNATAEQDLRMVMQELEREQSDQLIVNPSSPQFSVVRAMDESSIACLELRPSCDR